MCSYEFQCQYGSIGWSVGAALGYGIGEALSGKRLIASIGDGSFQVTAQVSALSHLIRTSFPAPSYVASEETVLLDKR